MVKDKRVLVTGGSGFIGSHLVKRLHREGADVYVMTRYDSVIENIRLDKIWNDINIIEADIRNLDSLRKVKEIQPEIVFHLAAYNHVGDSFTHVTEVFDVNAKGTANLVNVYEDYECFVYISSSEVYGLQPCVPFREDMCPQPISPYAISKYGGELYCRMKQHMNESPIVILRPFNAYGPYQTTKAIIPELIMNCLNGVTIKATEGRQTREFNYVEDLVDGFILAGENKNALGETINLGNGMEVSIRDLISMIVKLTKADVEVKMGAIPYRPTEIWRMCADNTKARDVLGWNPQTSLEEGLRRTIEWYKSSMHKIYGL
ncbi:MAG: GDP-mannose 4,6-dehydratase [Methanocellales archaeon]|nr:GDP-mannose 4,6-dehydratase [Methanocellales archaeon]